MTDQNIPKESEVSLKNGSSANAVLVEALAIVLEKTMYDDPQHFQALVDAAQADHEYADVPHSNTGFAIPEQEWETAKAVLNSSVEATPEGLTMSPPYAEDTHTQDVVGKLKRMGDLFAEEIGTRIGVADSDIQNENEDVKTGQVTLKDGTKANAMHVEALAIVLEKLSHDNPQHFQALVDAAEADHGYEDVPQSKTGFGIPEQEWETAKAVLNSSVEATPEGLTMSTPYAKDTPTRYVQHQIQEIGGLFAKEIGERFPIKPPSWKERMEQHEKLKNLARDDEQQSR